MKKKNTNNGGWSLTEIMVAILILGIAAAASIPAFGGFAETYRLSSEADQLASALRTARGLAIMKNTTSVLTFSTTADTYFYFEDDDGSGSASTGEYKSAQKMLPTGFAIDSHTLSGTQVVFGPKGNTLEGGTITLAAIADPGKTKVVRIMSGTGNIRIE